VLYVGRADPYKNIETLIRAFAAARAIVPFPLVLTIAGSSDPRYPEPARLVEELDVASAVHRIGYLSDDRLATLYQQADVLAHASRYEGFGLQIAEAMACGLPVVCSNAGSLPEVAGEAAVLLDPDDAGGFANAIADILTNDARRRNLVQQGLRQAAQFRWTRTAESVLRIYRELTAGTC
jgi:glycosyltransferase involved in cell wall biosynthesis